MNIGLSSLGFMHYSTTDFVSLPHSPHASPAHPSDSLALPPPSTDTRPNEDHLGPGNRKGHGSPGDRPHQSRTQPNDARAARRRHRVCSFAPCTQEIATMDQQNIYIVMCRAGLKALSQAFQGQARGRAWLGLSMGLGLAQGSESPKPGVLDYCLSPSTMRSCFGPGLF